MHSKKPDESVPDASIATANENNHKKAWRAPSLEIQPAKTATQGSGFGDDDGVLQGTRRPVVS